MLRLTRQAILAYAPGREAALIRLLNRQAAAGQRVTARNLRKKMRSYLARYYPGDLARLRA